MKLKQMILTGGICTLTAGILFGYQNFISVTGAGSSSAPMYRFKTSFASETLWPAQNFIDSNALTAYSSNYFPTSKNDRGLSVAAWTNSFPGQTQMNRIILVARVVNGRVMGFPLNYDLYVANATGTAWVLAGNFSNQPDSNGIAIISLGKTYNTNGILLYPKVLGVDSYRNHYFQLAEMSFVNLPEVNIPATFTMTAGQVLPVGKMTVVYQTDGNFVVYENLWAPNQRTVWATMSFTNCLPLNCTATVSRNTGSIVLSKSGTSYWSGKFFSRTASSTNLLPTQLTNFVPEGGGGR